MAATSESGAVARRARWGVTPVTQNELPGAGASVTHTGSPTSKSSTTATSRSNARVPTPLTMEPLPAARDQVAMRQ